ncbi:histone-lysine N-methyltransferase SETMAR [Trichonephila clavipes]|nr:histone-lysine N-methyltransferase SETMAR [Trichonephila clavipes]
MSRFVVCLKRDLQSLRRKASLVLIYRPNVAGMKGRVDLAQPVNRTPDLWCGSKIHYNSTLFVDEAWLYYDPTIKQQSSEWKHPSSPILKKAKTVKSAGKVKTIIFYYEGIVYQHAVEPGTTLNDSCYTNVLRTMVQNVKRKRPLLRNDFLLHYDNARPHIARCVLCVSQQNNVEILPHPPYRPGLTSCDFWLFPQLKKLLRGKRFASNKVCVKAAWAILKQLSQNGLLHVFKKWTELWDKCIMCHGSYFEKNHANDDD